MIIQCERCTRKFKIDDSLIKPPGNRVKCSKCGNTFFVERKQDPEPKTPYSSGHTYEKALESESNGVKIADRVENEPKSTPEFVQTNEAIKTHLTREPKGGINWEEFVSITKSKAEEGRFDTDTKLDRDENTSGFDWAKLSIDEESPESLPTVPQFFDEPLDERESNAPREFEPRQDNKSQVDLADVAELTIDHEKSYVPKSVSTRTAANRPHHNSYAPLGETLLLREGLARRVIKKFIYIIIALVVFSVIISAGVAILANQGFIPQDQLSKFSNFVLAKLPIMFAQDPAKDLPITDLTGRWMTTRNGLIYVVSGKITNRSKYVVNYVQLRSEFISDGKNLFKDAVYAGNTFTKNELKTSSADVIMDKLDRKNGDINFDDPRKLAGLNYGIEPGESVPFFTVFPSQSQILGLRYRVGIAGFEKSVSRE